MPLQLEITTPERTLLKETVDSVTIPTAEGEITVLPHHIPLSCVLVPGALTVRKEGEESYVAVSTGFVLAREGKEVLILADTAERAEELDMEKIEAARARARQAILEHGRLEDTAFAEAAAALERELARLRVAGKRRSRGAPGVHTGTLQ